MKLLDYSGLQRFLAKIKTLLDSKANAQHTHSTSDVTDLLSDQHTWSSQQSYDADLNLNYSSTDVDDIIDTLAGSYTAEDFLAQNNVWTGTNTYTKYQNAVSNTEIGVTPSETSKNGILFTDKDGHNIGWLRHQYDTSGDICIEMLVSNKYKDGTLDPTGTQVYRGVKQTITSTGASYFGWSGYVNNSVNPYTTDTFDIGDPTHQWNNLYAKNYFYNGTQWGLDKANVWTDTNTFSSTLKQVNSAITKGTNPQSDINAFNVYWGGTGVSSLTNALFTQRGYVYADGSTAYILYAEENVSGGTHTSLSLKYDPNDTINQRCALMRGDFRPYYDNSFNLGIPTLRWKSVYANAYYLGTTAFGDIVTHNASEFLTDHPTISTSTDTTSTASPAHSGTFTCIDSVTRDSNGHVTAVNTKTVTLPADNNTDTKVTNTLGTTTKAYVTGTTSATTNTGTQIFDTGVYLSTTAGELVASKFTGALNGNANTATQFSANKDVTLTGDVTGTASSKAGWSVATTLSDSGVAAGTYGPSADVTGNNNATISVPEITVDSKGRVTSVTNRTLTCKNNTYSVYNKTLTIQKNGTNVATFTSNSNTDVTADITVPTKVSELDNDSGFLTSHQSLSNYVTLNGAQTISATKSFSTNITTASTSTSQRETWGIAFTKTDTNGGGASALGVVQPKNSSDFFSILRLSNPRGNNKPTSGDGINTGNCWAGIGVYFNFALNRGYPYASSCTRWDDSSNSDEHIASTSWVRRYCETTKKFLTSHQSLSNYSTLANTVKSLSISGKTITVTPGSGSAYTLTTQDTVYTHPTTAGNKHVPSGGSSGQFLGWDSAGTAKWVNNPNSDTKNTAGSTDTSSKIFLIGATSQAANPQTYSHDTAYVGTDGCLYSGGTKVLTAHQSLSNYSTLANTVKSLSISGKTITVTPGSGNAYTLTTQDTVYTHPTTAGNKHIPSGGNSNQILRYSASGTAVWSDVSFTRKFDQVFNTSISATATSRLPYTDTVSLTASQLAVVTIDVTTDNTLLIKVTANNIFVIAIHTLVGTNAFKQDSVNYGSILQQTAPGRSRLAALILPYNSSVTFTTAIQSGAGANNKLNSFSLTVYQ